MENNSGTIIRASWIAVIGNAVLSILKIVAGIISGSLAVLGDGIDSATDIVTSLITLIAARIMNRPPDPKYPYGYLKADTIATTSLSFVILFAGAQLAISTITDWIKGTEKLLPSMLAIYVTVFSIAGKIILAIHQYRIGKKTNSEMLKANSRNMQNDIFISVAVLIGLFFTFILNLPVIDSVTALFVSAWIIKVGIQIFLRTYRDLMDGVSDPRMYDKVFRAVKRIRGVYNPHRTRIRKIGNYFMIALDIEVEPTMNTQEAHDLVCKVEKEIRKEIDNVFDIMIHVEPFGNLDKEVTYGIKQSDINEN